MKVERRITLYEVADGDAERDRRKAVEFTLDDDRHLHILTFGFGRRPIDPGEAVEALRELMAPAQAR